MALLKAAQAEGVVIVHGAPRHYEKRLSKGFGSNPFKGQDEDAVSKRARAIGITKDVIKAGRLKCGAE